MCEMKKKRVITDECIKANYFLKIRRRGTYQSYVNIVYGVASALGAALGGMMADSMGWRWEFGIQVFPIVLCFAVAYYGIPDDLGIENKHQTFAEGMKTFDYSGSVLLTISTTFLILGLVCYGFFFVYWALQI